MKPSYEELEEELRQTKELLKKALERIAALEEQLNRNSKNSSKPPSTDQKSNTSDKSKKTRQPKEGKARAPFPSKRVDKHLQCTRENCPHCGSSTLQLREKLAEVLQQAELPEVRAIVTQYELLKYNCLGCGKNSVAPLPSGVPDSAFGPKLMGLLATLTGGMHVAKREAIQLIKDLYDIDISVGSVPNIEERVAKTLDPVYDRIHKFVIESKWCKHFDETGWRDSGKRHFVWLASCEHAAVYMIDRTRSSAAFKKLIGKEEWKAPSVTDRYGVYFSLPNHQYCLAHLIREFKKYAERDGPDAQIGRELVKELSFACVAHKEYREGESALPRRNRRLGHCKRRVKYWLLDGLANGSDALSKLCDGLFDRFEKLWTFTKIDGMEPTNNAAERDLRKLVIWRKKSYGTRSERGKRFVERITTVIQTLRRQNQNALHFIQKAVASFYFGGDAPFIAEAMGF